MPNMSLKKNEMPSQEPQVRNKNFLEVALGYTEEQALDEAQRCLHCKNKPCVSGCPLGIPREKVMALGDNGNDVTMLEYAGVSVCMGDGSDSAKAAAKFLTAPHTEDGLAKAIRKFALKN